MEDTRQGIKDMDTLRMENTKEETYQQFLTLGRH
jgi:hypothetical protein